ncbi:MAG: FUSC family protein [Proteobacteria bacterium]|nr:FUSC family protein [Pseudomonadota bacterium]
MDAPAWSARQGLLTAGSVVLALVFAASLGIEGMWWAAISAWMVSNPDFRAMLSKAVMRLVGTIGGLALGYALAIAMEGFVPFQALAVFVASAGGCYLRFGSRYGYAWFYGCITLVLMITVSITQTDTLFTFAQFRFMEIACGVVASALVHRLGRPRPSQLPPPAPAAAASEFDLPHVALVGGFATLAMMGLWSLTDLPDLPQAIVSCLVVLDRDFATVQVRARQRFIGCMLGMLLGLVALLFEFDSMLVYVTVLFAGIFYFSRLHNGAGPQAYIGTQGGFAFITAMVTDNGPPNALLPVIDRLAGVVIGVVVIVAISFVLSATLRRARPVASSASD